MSFGIYKPNQGYWVRVMTAIFVGILVLSGAVWAWSQAGTIRLPTPTWTMSVASVDGSLEVGSLVSMIGMDDDGASVPIGSASVLSYEDRSAGRAVVVIGEIEMEAGYDPSQTERVTAEGFNSVLELRGASGNPAFERTYLQGAAAGVMIILGTILVFSMVAVRKRPVEFLIATDGEMKKVNWSTKREVYGSTVVVIVATFLIAAILFAIDLGFSQVFELVGVLER